MTRQTCSRSAFLAVSILAASPAAAESTAMQRAALFGITDIRGVVYIPGPQGPARPIDPSFNAPSGLPMFIGQLRTFTPSGQPFGQPLDAKFTIYNDSDFYNADFPVLWGPAGGRGRDDLGRFRKELNVNYIRPYDWQSNAAFRNHAPFLAYAAQLGMRVSIPISNYTLKIMCNQVPTDRDWKGKIAGVFNQVYGAKGTMADRAAGALEIFNEYDNFFCRNAKFVVDVAAEWKRLEDLRSLPDSQRLPIIVSVTFSLKNGLPGGAILDVFKEMSARPQLGAGFWRARMIHAVNTFNDGPFMRTWVTTNLPQWYRRNSVPADTPVVFTEYGTSSAVIGESRQATRVAAQFSSMWTPAKPANFLGAMAFVPEYRFWERGPEPDFAILNFNGGPGSWGKPATMFVQTVQYQNPNAPLGQLWTARYQVDPQRPRQAYCEVGKVFYKGSASARPACP